MRRIVLVGLATALLGTTSVQAADALTSLYSPTPAAQSFDWSGAYIGVVGGLGMWNSTFSDFDEEISYDGVDLSGWGGSLGATVGYNVQMGSMVVGVEGDVNWSNFGVSFYDDSYGTQHDRAWNWYSTLRLRAGLAHDNTLVYATAGLAAVGVDFVGDYNPTNACGTYWGYCLDETVLGLALGGGVEMEVADSMSVKLEGLYIGLPTSYADEVYEDVEDAYAVSSSAFIARAGLNWRF